MKVFLTGGGGFLGGATAKRLREHGHEVRSFSRKPHAELAALGVEHVQGDLGDRDAVVASAAGCDAIVHTAAKAGVWGHYPEFWRANVVGTRHVIDACRAHGIQRLVHTSSPAVVHRGGDIHGGDASLPLTDVYWTHYQETKAWAEREALAANGPDLAVVALRPHLIWGPGDPHMGPRIVSRVRNGRIALPGGGVNVIDTLYIENGADALVQALEALRPGASLAGRAYFVTNGEPRAMRDMVLGIARAAGKDARVVAIPLPIARAAGSLLESTFRWVDSETEPLLTRFTVEYMASTHHFDISAAERDFGWTPRVSIDEGFEALRESYASSRT
ncbi:MAG: NAD-dependent epimerase/dehydratase family protein [Sandaracinaceae bacterium]